MQKEKAQFQPIDLIKYGILFFLFFAFVESVHNFHYNRLYAPLPYGYVIGREGKIPSMKEEKIIFRKKFNLNNKKEMRIWIWGREKGVLKLNGEEIFYFEKPDLYFLRITKDKLKETNEMEVLIESSDGFSALWFSDISGLGSDRSWECFIEDKKLKTRIFGKPAIIPIFTKIN